MDISDPEPYSERVDLDKDELTTILRGGPAIIRMNDGRSYEVPGLESTLIGDIAASILHRGEDGKLRHVYLPLVTMSAVDAAPEQE